VSNELESKKNPRIHEFYLTNEEIGEGGFGKVYIAKDRLKEEKKYVAKEIKNYKSIKESLIINELLIGTELYNKNLVKIFEPFLANGKFYFICEYCNGNNLNELYKNNNINEEIVQKIMKNVLFGLSALHRNGIIHHDLKEGNILINFNDLNDLNNKNYLKADYLISDFGLSKYKDNILISMPGGTSIYLPPEKIEQKFNQNLITDDSYFNNESIDIWAIGIITYRLLLKCDPFLNKNFNYKNLNEKEQKQIIYKHLYENMKKGEYEIDWKNYDVSYELICFLDSCLKKSPEIREKSEDLEFSRFITRDFKKFHKIDQNYFDKLPKEFKKDDKIILNINNPDLIKNNKKFKPL
jgi:serine/threonine protein kinase